MRLTLELLGGFRVLVDDRPVAHDAWKRRRAAGLVKLLALAPKHVLPRDTVIEELWPHLEPQAATANLHKTAHHVRRIVGVQEAVVLADRQARLLPQGEVVVDAARFESAAREALRTGDATACDRAAAAYAGELLPDDLDAPWTEASRRHLHRLYCELLRTAERWERLAEADPADEHAHRELIRHCLDKGDAEGAIRRFQHLTEVLAGYELRPGVGTRALYERALEQRGARRPRPHRGAFIGREEEVAAARKAMRGAVAGSGTTVLVEGPEGIGKTRLGLALVDEALDADWAVAVSAATSSDARVPYAPIADAADSLLADRPEVLHLLPDDMRATISALTRRETQALDDPPRVLEAVIQLLTSAAGTNAALVLVDDVHAADEASLALLEHLCNAARFRPIVAILTFRTAEAPPALRALRESLLARRVCTLLSLSPLDRADAQELARRSARHRVPDASLDRIWRLGEGNPLFTEELAANLGPGGSVQASATLAGVIDARLATLPDDLRGALERTAVAGATFDAQSLAAMAGLDRAKAARLLDTALAHGITVADGQRHRFRHELIRQALARAVPAHQRAAVHAEAAAWLIGAGASAAEIAHHARLGERSDAAEWHLRAAETALAARAYADALAFARHGLEQAPAALVPALHELQADALLGLGDPRAAAAYGEALEAAGPARRETLRIKQARACLAVGAIDAAECCVADVHPADRGEEARLLVVRALIAWYRDLDTAGELTRRARQMALEAGSATEVSEVLALQVMAAHSAAQWRLSSLVQWMDSYEGHSLGSIAVDPHLCVADYLSSSDRHADEVVAFAERIVQATTRSRSQRGRAFASIVLGQAELARGELASAEQHLRDSCELHRKVGSVAGEVIAVERLAEIARLRGDPERADALLDQALDASQWSSMSSHLFMRVHATRVRNRAGEAAIRVVDEFFERFPESELCPMCSVAFRLAAASACAQAGQVAQARDHVAAIEALGVVTQRGLLGAELTVAKAEVALAAGDDAAAHRLLVDAVGAFEDLGHGPAADACRARAAGFARAGA